MQILRKLDLIFFDVINEYFIKNIKDIKDIEINNKKYKKYFVGRICRITNYKMRV